MELSEKQIQQQIEDYLRASGWFVWRSPHIPRKPGHNYQGTTGEPDVKAVRKREFVMIEVKRPGGKATAQQLMFMKRINGEGFKAFVAQSVEEVMEVCK